MTARQDAAAFARSATSNPHKCDRRLDVPIYELLEERLIALASLTGANGITKSEYARRVLEEHVFGKFSIVQQSLREPRAPADGKNDG